MFWVAMGAVLFIMASEIYIHRRDAKFRAEQLARWKDFEDRHP